MRSCAAAAAAYQRTFFAGSKLHLSPKQARPFVKFYFAAKDFNRRICKIFVGIKNLTPPMKKKVKNIHTVSEGKTALQK